MSDHGHSRSLADERSPCFAAFFSSCKIGFTLSVSRFADDTDRPRQERPKKENNMLGLLLETEVEDEEETEVLFTEAANASPYLSTLTADDISCMASHLSVMSFDVGDIIMEKGETGMILYAQTHMMTGKCLRVPVRACASKHVRALLYIITRTGHRETR
jgi:hypothetical protein